MAFNPFGYVAIQIIIPFLFDILGKHTYTCV